LPKVDAAAKTYDYLKPSTPHVASCHDCSDGGLVVALAETAFAGGLGMDIDLNRVPTERLNKDAHVLFSESASRFVVTVSTNNAAAFERPWKACPAR
jgi:phosphoribosylformylglycinamidine synthase